MTIPPKLVNLVLGLTTVVISLAAGEAALRAVVRLPLRRVLPEVKYAPHPVRRFTLVPNQNSFSYGAPARIDGRGFRLNSDSPRPTGKGTRILALGDSFTFGLGVRNSETWPAQLEARLIQAGHPVDILNAGTISYGEFQELDLLKTEGLATRPKIVIHALYWNDFMNASAPLPDTPSVVDSEGYFVWDQLSRPIGTLSRIRLHAASSSALVFVASQALKGARASGSRAGNALSSYGDAYARFVTGGLTEQEWQPIEQFYVELKELAAAHDFGVFVVILPVSDIVKGASPHTHPYPVAARQMLERLGIPFLDGFQLWSDRRYHIQHFLPEGADAHLNAEGYRALTDPLAQALVNIREFGLQPQR